MIPFTLLVASEKEKHMRVEEQVAKFLKISVKDAGLVVEQMGMDGLNFSECTRRQFNKSAREAYDYLLMCKQTIR